MIVGHEGGRFIAAVCTIQAACQNFHHHGKSSPFNASSRKYGAFKGFHGIHCRLAIAIKSPSGRYFGALLMGHDQFCPVNPGKGHVDDNGIGVARAAEGYGVCAESRPVSSPWSHGGRGIGHNNGHKPLPGKTFGKNAQGPAVVGMAHTCHGEALFPAQRHERVQGHVNGGKRKAPVRVNHDNGRSLLHDLRFGIHADFFFFHLINEKRNPRNPVRRQSVELSGQERGHHAPRCTLVRSCGSQSGHAHTTQFFFCQFHVISPPRRDFCFLILPQRENESTQREKSRQNGGGKFLPVLE